MTTHDGPLTGVHLPIHRCRGSGTRVGLSTRAGSAYNKSRRVVSPCSKGHNYEGFLEKNKEKLADELIIIES